jgi:hypothetical protein
VGNVFVRNLAHVFERSTDNGVTWTPIVLNAKANLVGVSGNDLLGASSTNFVAWQFEVDANNQMQAVFYTSTDGLTWTSAQDFVTQSVHAKCLQPTASSFNPLYGKANGNRFYVAGNSCVASTDGVTWQWEFYDATNAAAGTTAAYGLSGLGFAGATAKPFILTSTNSGTLLSTIP